MNVDLDLQKSCEAWKAGQTVWSAELGGLGPGYEQCIQIVLWNFLSEWTGGPLKVSEKNTSKEYTGGKFSKEFEASVAKLKGLGLSGGQVGAAKQTAFQFLKYGYPEMMAKLPQDRWIQVSRDFPKVDA